MVEAHDQSEILGDWDSTVLPPEVIAAISAGVRKLGVPANWKEIFEVPAKKTAFRLKNSGLSQVEITASTLATLQIHFTSPVTREVAQEFNKNGNKCQVGPSYL